MPRRNPPAIPDDILGRLLSGSDPRAALAGGGLLDGLKKALAERALSAEMDHHPTCEAARATAGTAAAPRRC